MTAGPEATVLEAARASGLLGAGRPVVVLLSGGRDSTCLLDVGVRLAGPEAISALTTSAVSRRRPSWTVRARRSRSP